MNCWPEGESQKSGNSEASAEAAIRWFDWGLKPIPMPARDVPKNWGWWHASWSPAALRAGWPDEPDLIVATEVGHLGVEGVGRATCYRITECGTRESYEATKDYRRWSPGKEFAVVKGKAAARSRGLPPAEHIEHEADVIVVPIRRGGSQ